MQTENNLKAVPARKVKRKTRTRILKWVLALAVVLIVSAILLVPVFVSSETGRKIILAKINDSLNGEINFASLSMSWWKGIKVTDVSFNDSTGQTLIEVKQIATKPHYGSILMGSLCFGETIIDEPKAKINLVHQLPEKAGSYRQKPSAGKKTQAITLPIKKIDLVINDGNLKVTDQQAETVELSQINSRLNLRPPGQQTNFDIDMAVVDKGKESKIRAGGQIIPKRRTGWSLKGTSGNLTIEAGDLELASLGPIFALAGVEVQAKGLVSANIKSKIKDGQVEDLSGTIKGENLDITGAKLKGDRLKSSHLDVAIKLRGEEGLINVDKLEVHSDWVNARVSGVVPTMFKLLAEFVKPDSIYNLKGSFDCDLAAALSQMPRTLRVREGIKVTSGQLSGNIETLTKDGKRKISGQASLTELQGIVNGKRIALAEPVRAKAEITSDETGLKFDKLDLSSAFCKVNCTGTSKLLRYNANVNLARLQAELGQFINVGQYQMTGELFSKGTLSSSKDKINAAGSSEIKDLRLSSVEGVSALEPKADIDFSVALEQDKNILNIDFIKANASIGQVSIKDAVLPLNKKAAKPMELTVSANNIDLKKLQPFAVVFGILPKEMQMAGIAESQLSVSSKKDTYTITTDSTKIKNLKLLSPGQEPFIQEQVLFIFDGDYNPTENNWAVRKLQFISPNIEIKFGFEKSVQRGKTKLEGRLDYKWDWAAVSTVASAFLPKGLKLEGQNADTIDFFCEYPTGQTEKLLANFNTKAKLGFEKADYMGLNFGPTEVDIQIQNGLLTIAPFSTSVNGGKLSFAGNINFKEKPILLRTTGPMQIIENVNINDAIRRHLLIYINPIFVDQINVSGVSNFYCEKLSIPIGGTTKDGLEVIGTIGIDKMRLEAVGLLGYIISRANVRHYLDSTLMPTRFELRKDILSYDNMQINVDKYPVNFSGAIGPDIKLDHTMKPDKKLDMTVTIPYAITPELKFKTVKVGEEAAGERIPVKLGGRLHEPKFDLDWAKLAEGLFRKRLKKEFDEQLQQKLLEALDRLLK